MKLLYYHQYFQTRNSAGGTRSYEFSRRMIESGHEVTIVCARSTTEDLTLNEYIGRGYRRGKVDGINVIQIDLQSSNKTSFLKRTVIFLRFVLKSVSFVFKEDFDVLLATSTPLTIGIPGILLKIFKPKRKFIFEVRDLWPELPKAMGVIKNPVILWLMKKLEIKIYRSADACIGLSPGIIDGIAKYKRETDRIKLIPNACDIDLFSPGIEKKEVFPGCDENLFVAIFTGAHGLANGLDYLLDAAMYLKKANEKKIRIVLIGDGSQKPRLVQKAASLSLDNCIFLDPVPKVRLANLMKSADAGLMILANVPAFSYGTSPNKYFDYIACGLPVIVNHKGWVADMIKENSCGYCVDAEKPEELADSLVKLSNDPALRTKFRSNSRKLAESQFDRDKLSSLWISFINEVYLERK